MDIWEEALKFEAMFAQGSGVSEVLTTGATSRRFREAIGYGPFDDEDDEDDDEEEDDDVC